MKKRGLIITSISVILLMIFYLYNVGYTGIWLEGISSIAYNTAKYTDENGHIIEGEYSISINLSDLESNIGKELYNDGINKIYVSFIDNTENISSGGYRIGFRSSGVYSINDAILVSGVRRFTVDGKSNSFTNNMSAKMVANYQGEDYVCLEFGRSGLNYKDGDEFSFYIFPSYAYKENKISFREQGVINLTVTNLYKNIWIKY